MPVSRLQSEILRLLASRRDPESFVAGGVAINRAGPRISRDIDIFHDREERVATTALEDARVLASAVQGVALALVRCCDYLCERGTADLDA